MIKPILYIYDGGELEEVITGIKHIKKYIDKLYKEKYESNTETSTKKVKGDSGEASGGTGGCD